MTALPHFQLIDGAALRFRQWGDETVVYCGASGDTHLLEANAARLLTLLEREPLTAEQLLQQLELAHDEDAAAVRNYLQMALEHLEKLGLVNRR